MRVFQLLFFYPVVLQFESSGKWPEDLTAIQHIKAAFHIRLAELLRTKCSMSTAASRKHLDVQKVRQAGFTLIFLSQKFSSFQLAGKLEHFEKHPGFEFLEQNALFSSFFLSQDKKAHIRPKVIAVVFFGFQMSAFPKTWSDWLNAFRRIT